MKRITLVAPLLMSMALACGSDPPPDPVTPTAAPTATTPPPAPTPTDTAPPPPSPEEVKKADDAKKLEADRTKMKADMETEKGRWTADMRAEATKVADKVYPTAKDGVKAVMAAKFRKPENAARDKYRHPVETLDLFGLKPTMTVIEYGPGEGWYTELLAPTLAKKGKLIDTSSDPNGPQTERSTLNGQRWQAFMNTSPELYGKVESYVIPKDTFDFGHEGQVDMVIATRELHGMVNNKKLGDFLAGVNKALKPGGIFGVEEHRAAEGANPEETAKKGYLPEKYVIEQVEAAGFKLDKKSDINANKADTKDYPDGVWDLPPTLRKGETDKDKYTKIGESDRMTLKFVKAMPKAPVMGVKPPTDKK
jgi:predicted methyltransferase